MDKKSVLKIVSDFKEALKSEGIEPEKIILFGSYAAGDYHEGSDIDLVVISKDFEDKTYWQRINILSSAVYSVFQPIEVVALSPEEWESDDTMIADYARNGEIVC